MHEQMVRIRVFESEAGRLIEAGRLPGFLHLSVGQEAVAVGVISVLGPDDQVTSTHRGHGHAIAKGADMTAMYAELFGKSTGSCGGMGGSMHINDTSLGMLGANGVVGAGIPIAVGSAFASWYRGDDSVAVSFFGDGAANIGAFHEAANLAAVLSLPVIFVCENNGYAEFSPQSAQTRIADIADRAASYGMPGEVVDGMDVLAVREGAARAVDRARGGGGPTLIEAKTYRYHDHQGVKGLRVRYRGEEEVDSWRSRDCLDAMEARLVADGARTREQITALWAGSRPRSPRASALLRGSRIRTPPPT
jgi:pyruvate dehydrogenase E1 component alpha subunit